MSNFWLLCKVNIASLLTFNSKKKKLSTTNKVTSLASVALLYVLIVGGLGTAYSFMYAEILNLTGKIVELVPTMIGMSAIVSFAFSFYAVSSVLYGFKDYDFLSSLPVTKSAIVLSKLSAMMIIDVLFALFIAIPATVFYGLNATITVGFVLKSLVYAILSPLIPIALSIVIGALFTFISAKAKFKNLITTVLYLLVVVVAFVFSFSSAEDGNIGFIQKLYFVMPLLVKGYSNGLSVLLYVGVSIVPFALIILCVSATFDKMNALTKSHPKNKNFRLKARQGRGEFHTLFVREFKRLGTCPLYLMNSAMGAIMPIVGAIALVVLTKTMDAQIVAMLSPFILPFAPVLFVFSFGLAPTTNCCISIEGKSFWLTRTLPVSAKNLFNAKLAVNSVLYVASALISTIILAILLRLKFLIALLFVAFAVVLAFFNGVLGLFINLKKPTLDWDNIQKAVKQGTSIFITVMVAMFMSLVFGVIGYFMLLGQGTAVEFLTKLSPELYFGILVALLGTLSIWLYTYLIKNGEKILLKITG